LTRQSSEKQPNQGLDASINIAPNNDSPTYTEPSDQELFTLIDMVYKPPAKPDPNYIDLGTKVFPCILDEFFDTFLSKSAPMNQSQFYKTLPGYRDIKFEDSKESSTIENVLKF
jgi:hypothetical protein